jgi:hypothetical protein
MKKLFGQIAFVLSLLCFSNAFAQQVVYSLKDGKGKPLGQMVFNYKSTGYEATMNGEKLAVEVSGNTAVATMGKLIITMSVDGGYYHNRVGFWRTMPVTTSFGDKGIAKMFYAGMTPNGRLYREELWLNGRLFNRSETVIDHNDQIVWSVANDSEGTLRLARM